MDTYRGWPEDDREPVEHESLVDPTVDGGAVEAPSPVGTDERRMQVRAYNFWAGLLQDRNFPSIEDLDPEALPDFGPYSVLLDFTSGIEDPAVHFLGDKLARECGTEGEIHTLADVPSRSLLSRITDHYMQILANQAPIGFEAEFVNQRGQTILYRGILLPFSSDDDTIDFIYGVINWKELADQRTTDELMLEIDQSLDAPIGEPAPHREDAMAMWADAPLDPAEAGTAEPEARLEATAEPAPDDEEEGEDVLDLAALIVRKQPADIEWPEPSFGGEDADDPFAAAADPDEAGDDVAAASDERSIARHGHEILELAAADAVDASAMELADWLASARELALAACSSEDRTRGALYAAIGRAYDFSLAAQAEPESFAELVADAGLAVQERAPMTPVVKLVFGADYDKTRLTEYAAALEQAHRVGLTRGALADYLGAAPGGLKGVVAEERRWRKSASGKAVEPRHEPRKGLARKLRKLEPLALADLPAAGQEFALLVARRLPDGRVVVLGEVPEDIALFEKAAKKLLA